MVWVGLCYSPPPGDLLYFHWSIVFTGHLIGQFHSSDSVQFFFILIQLKEHVLIVLEFVYNNHDKTHCSEFNTSNHSVIEIFYLIVPPECINLQLPLCFYLRY